MINTNELNEAVKVKAAMCHYAVAHELRDRANSCLREKSAGRFRTILNARKRYLPKVYNATKDFSKRRVPMLNNAKNSAISEVRGLANNVKTLSSMPGDPAIDSINASIKNLNYTKRQLNSLLKLPGIGEAGAAEISRKVSAINKRIATLKNKMVASTGKNSLLGPGALLDNLVSRAPGGWRSLAGAGLVGSAGLSAGYGLGYRSGTKDAYQMGTYPPGAYQPRPYQPIMSDKPGPITYLDDGPNDEKEKQNQYGFPSFWKYPFNMIPHN